MKPNFALDLSHTGIRLLELAQGGEVELGAVSLDDPDFDARIAELRDRARKAAKGPIRTELVIPPSEILYTEIDAPGADRTERAQAVRSRLAELTPYALDELVYDWRAAKDRALVAAVARVTLDEARDFALSHGFNPVRYAARPQDGQFRGRPDFGAVAGAVAGAGPAVADEADDVAGSVPNAPEEGGGTDVAAGPRAAGHDADATPAAEGPTAAAPVGPPPDTDGDGEDTADRGDGPADGRSAGDEAATASAAGLSAPGSAPPTSESTASAPARSHGPDGTSDATRATRAPAPPEAASGDAGPSSRRMHLAVPASAPQVSPAVDDVPAPLAATHPAARGWPLTRAEDAAEPETAAPDGAGTALPFASRRTRGDEAAETAESRADSAALQAPTIVPGDRPTAAPRAHPGDRDPAPASAAARSRALPPPVAGTRARRMAAGRGLGEAEALTVFGARPAEGVPARRWGRAGGLAAAAAGIAALVWGAYFLIGDPASEIAPAMTGTASSLAAPPAEARAPVAARLSSPVTQAAPAPAPTARSAPASSARALAPTATGDAARAGDGAPPPPAAAAPGQPAPAQATPALPAPLTPDQATARYAATGIWQLSPLPPQPPQGDRVDGLYTAALDPEVAQAPASDLLPPARDRLALAAPPQTAQGGGAASGRREANAAPAADTGVRIIDGPPPAIPPAPPARADAAAPRAQPVADGAADGAPADPDAVAEAFLPGPDMPRTRPLPRPAGPTPAQSGAADPAPATAEPAAVAGAPPGAEPAPRVAQATADTLRPLARPAGAVTEPALQDRAQAAAIAAAAASALASAADSPDEAADAEPEPDQISPYAVASSVAPRSRPGDLRASRRSAAAQVAAPSSVVTPSAPTNASVARKATAGDALSLGRMNLIGVYGTATNRRALLRLPSGKFVKVKVGDRVDGGRIAAIGAAELRYVKRGQNITLTMPRS